MYTNHYGYPSAPVSYGPVIQQLYYQQNGDAFYLVSQDDSAATSVGFPGFAIPMFPTIQNFFNFEGGEQGAQVPFPVSSSQDTIVALRQLVDRVGDVRDLPLEEQSARFEAALGELGYSQNLEALSGIYLLVNLLASDIFTKATAAVIAGTPLITNAYHSLVRDGYITGPLELDQPVGTILTDTGRQAFTPRQ